MNGLKIARRARERLDNNDRTTKTTNDQNRNVDDNKVTVSKGDISIEHKLVTFLLVDNMRQFALESLGPLF